MWFEDLTPYNYFPRSKTGPSVPARNVGWLERGNPFAAGAVSLIAVERLKNLVELAPTNVTRGMHFCDLCPSADDYSGVWGHAEIRVVGIDGTRYAAPTLIHHYVTAHNYQPPRPFLDALLRVADLRWDVAKERDLCFACGASMTRGPGHKATQGGKPVITASLSCETCVAGYSRAWPDE